MLQVLLLSLFISFFSAYTILHMIINFPALSQYVHVVLPNMMTAEEGSFRALS